MLDFVHSVPGRLRIQGAALRRNGILVRQVRQHLMQVSGVESVTANQATGSIVVLYDPHEVTCDALWGELTSLGLSRTMAGRAAQADTPSFGRIVAETVSKTVLTKLAERSAVALIGALV